MWGLGPRPPLSLPWALGEGAPPPPRIAQAACVRLDCDYWKSLGFPHSGLGREWQLHLPFLPSSVINALGRLPTRPPWILRCGSMGSVQLRWPREALPRCSPGPRRVSSSTALEDWL